MEYKAPVPKLLTVNPVEKRPSPTTSNDLAAVEVPMATLPLVLITIPLLEPAKVELYTNFNLLPSALSAPIDHLVEPPIINLISGVEESEFILIRA